jgi:hypothetical protein
MVTVSWQVWALDLSPRPLHRPLVRLASLLRGSKSLDEFVNTLNHEGWQSAFGSLRARQNNKAEHLPPATVSRGGPMASSAKRETDRAE